MAYSEVTSHVDRAHTVTWYAYDALGRRTLTESITGQTLQTLYDGKRFEVIREGETFQNGSLTTRHAAGGATANGVMQSNQATGERYRWISDGNSGRITSEDGYSVEGSRYGGRGVTLYGKGEAVAVNYSSSTGNRSAYLGKDVLGSVKTATTETGAVEDRYEYDAFGMVYQGDLSGGMNLGYTGKPYDNATGLYNYGFRDYKPQAARFTTVNPIRDGNNWFAYVNNDPVNWIDLWGLWNEKLETIVNAHIGDNAEEYVKGINDCDIWVEKVVKEAGISLPSTWSPATNTTVAMHVKNMANELQNSPRPGANIIFHNNNHALIGYLNDDGTFDIAQNTSNPESYNRVYDAGNSETITYRNVAEFETIWGGANKPIYYVPLSGGKNK